MRVFLEENQNINLSAYREPEACWVGNVLDSVAAYDVIARCFDSAQQRHPERSGTPEGREAKSKGVAGLAQHDVKVIEVGMGGGFPLLPLAILFPEIEFTGLDATRKKVDAVQRIVEFLGLTNVRLLLGRAEELGHDSVHREQYDRVLARAVAPLATLLELMSPFAKQKGTMICWKMLSIEEEMQASITARLSLQSRLSERVEYELPGDWGKRQLLIFEKTGMLSPEYPRGVGIPKKEPL